MYQCVFCKKMYIFLGLENSFDWSLVLVDLAKVTCILVFSNVSGHLLKAQIHCISKLAHIFQTII